MFLFKKYNIRSRNIPIMLAVDFLGGFLFFLPILALYFEQSLFSAKNVAIIFAVEAVAMAIFEIPTGAISDIFGRRKTLIMSFATILLSLCFLLVGGSMAMFVVYAVLGGLARALGSGTDVSIIYDSLAEEGKEQHYKKVMGTYYAIWPLGASIGSIIGGYLAHVSLSTPVIYTFIPISISFILTFFLKEPKYHKSEDDNFFKHVGTSIRAILKTKGLLLLLSGTFIIMSLGESMHQLQPLLLKFKELPIIYFGYFGTVIFGFSSLGHYVGYAVSEKLGNKKTLIIFAVLSPIFGIAATLTHKYTAVFLLAIPSIFFGIRNVVLDYLFNQKIPSSHRATINSINNLTSRVGIAIFVPLIGYLADLYTVNIAFMISMVVILFIAPALFSFIKEG